MIDLSHKSVTGRFDVLTSHLLREKHGEIVSRGHLLEEALSHAVLLVARQTGCADISDAFVEADGHAADLNSSLHVCLVIVVILALHLSVQHALNREQLGPRAEELVVSHILRHVEHGVLIVLHVELELLRGVFTLLFS